MKWLALTLGVVALFFAGTTAYFARELHEERSLRTAATQAPTPVAVEASANSGASPASTSPPAVSADVAHPVTQTLGQHAPLSEEEMQQRAAEQSRKFLAQLSEPAGREKLLDEHKAMLKVGSQGMASYLKMDEDQFSRFIELLAEHFLAQREVATRCMLDPQCRYRGTPADMNSAQELELASTFGADTMERYRFFMRSSNERQLVTELRGRLPDNARLPDAKAEELVKVLVEETTRIGEDMKSVGYGIGTSNGLTFVVMDDDPDGKRAAAAAEYNRRLLDRASGVLTPAQLEAYAQLQNDTLEQSQAMRRLTSQ
jgi:hypothetical protein